MTLALRCDGISKSFGGVDALIDLTLEFPSCGVTALIGPNGAGKTTLIDVITGYTRPDAGACYVGDLDVTKWRSDRIARHGIARTFQDVRLARAVTVMENLLLATSEPAEDAMLFPRSVAREFAQRRSEEVRQWLELAGLSRDSERLAGALSYGQQKLLTLICCLGTQSQILILDEPVAGIDPEFIEKIIALLRTVSAAGRRIVIIEHDIATVRALADHVMVLDAGRLVKEGRADAVLNDPAVMDAYLG